MWQDVCVREVDERGIEDGIGGCCAVGIRIGSQQESRGYEMR